jgi:zinc protease
MIHRLLLATALLALSAAALAAPKIQHWTAASGARVYFVETRVLPILDIQIDFAAGGAFAPREKVGLASMTLRLMETGAGDLDEEKITGRLVDIGAKLSGSVDLDRAGFSLRTLSSQTEREAAVDLLRLILQQPTFPAAVMERERARMIAGIRESDTRPDSIGSKRFSAALYADHPYGANATEESVSSIGREELVEFYRTHYGANRAVISIVGDVSRAQAETIAQRLTDTLPLTPPGTAMPEIQLPKRETIRVAHPASQSHIYVGMPGIRRGDPDFFPLLVGNYILGGGGFVSRLTKEVREKRGYAYSVYSYFQPLKQQGPFQIGLQTKREQAEDALKVVDATLADFLRTGPTEEEMKAAKQYLVGGFALRLDSNRKILDHVGVIGFYGLPLSYLDEYQKQVTDVTAAQVRNAFQRRVRPENLVTVIVAGS